MAWSSQNTGFPYYSNYWQYNNAVSGIQRTSVNPTSYGRLTYLLPSYYTFKSDKTYQYEIEVQGNFTGVGMSASYQWTGNNPYDKIIGTNSGAGGRYYFYSSPTSDVTTLYSIYLSATGSLSGNTPNVSPSIVNLKLTEIDWLMSGTKRYNTGTNLTIDNVNYNGWSYQKSTDAFYWTNKPDPIMVSSNDPIIINSEFNGNANGWTLGFPYSPTQSATTYSAGTIVFGATGIGWLAQDVFGGFYPQTITLQISTMSVGGGVAVAFGTPIVQTITQPGTYIITGTPVNNTILSIYSFFTDVTIEYVRSVPSPNYIAKNVPYNYYNLSFNYQTGTGSFSGPNPDGFTIQTSTSLTGTRTTLYSISQSVATTNYAMYGLQGNGNYIFFVGSTTSNPAGFTASISNIKIDGGYDPNNNEQFLFTNNYIYSNPTTLQILGTATSGMTFSFVVGTGSNITNTNLSSPIHSQFGNGTFMAGIWENGVWNSGWRVDTEVYDLDNVGVSFRTTSDRKWRIQLVGPSASVSKFVIGDKVSIGNIVAIDINEVRKLLKGYFIITDKPTDTSLVVEIDLSFPIRRIEKDSPNHRIKITKNVWLNGSFLNGYYTGIWNYGLFKGFPRITEMFNTHWIDGTFDGGHFNSGHESGDISIKFYDTSFIHGNLGLVYASPHGYSMNDIIYINKDDKSINPQYDGQILVTEVTDKYNIVTNLTFGSSSVLEGGTSSNSKSTSLIQNFKFYDNNIATKVSSQSPTSAEIFQFNSWIDVNYYTTSAVNIGKPMTVYDTVAKMEYTQNNLYGYPTNDVLSSESTFRDSYSLNKRSYRLGTKYKIYSDGIGNASAFKSPFDMGQIGLDSFIGHYLPTYPYPFQGDGWTFSGTYSTYERSIEDTVYNATVTEEYTIKGEELVMSSTMSGSILNNINVNVEKNRYTVVELDIKSYSVGTNSTYYQASPDFVNFNWPISSLHPIPILNFNNINQYKHLLGVSSFWYEKMTYLPIYENINHLLTPGISKYEYFFNKPTLSMKLLGSDDVGTNFDDLPFPIGGDTGTTDGYYKSSVIMDNLKYYEVDMIPFFQYFLSSNIYNGVSTPWKGIAPFIDKTTYSNLLFID